MELLAGEEFAALMNKAGLGVRLVSRAVECSHVTVYTYIRGATPGKAKFALWAFAQFMKESLHYGALPLLDTERSHAKDMIPMMFNKWLVERVEFNLEELRARVKPAESALPLLDDSELATVVQGEDVEL